MLQWEGIARREKKKKGSEGKVQRHDFLCVKCGKEKKKTNQPRRKKKRCVTECSGWKSVIYKSKSCLCNVLYFVIRQQ